MKTPVLKWGGAAVLVLVLAVFGRLLVPVHLTSLWMDREFTDWVSPIANRLHNGARLYTDGLHFPMPPLPYVLLRLLHPNGAIWIQENFLFYLFQAGTLLLLYFLLAPRAGIAVAFAAVMAALPLFLSFEKSILYDAMAQFLVAAAGGVCAGLISRSSRVGRQDSSKFNWRWLLLQGVMLGLLLLCKQS